MERHEQIAYLEQHTPANYREEMQRDIEKRQPGWAEYDLRNAYDDFLFTAMLHDDQEKLDWCQQMDKIMLPFFEYEEGAACSIEPREEEPEEEPEYQEYEELEYDPCDMLDYEWERERYY